MKGKVAASFGAAERDRPIGYSPDAALAMDRPGPFGDPKWRSDDWDPKQPSVGAQTGMAAGRGQQAWLRRGQRVGGIQTDDRRFCKAEPAVPPSTEVCAVVSIANP